MANKSLLEGKKNKDKISAKEKGDTNGVKIKEGPTNGAAAATPGSILILENCQYSVTNGTMNLVFLQNVSPIILCYFRKDPEDGFEGWPRHRGLEGWNRSES
jgi:hypothetical protein